MGTGIAIDSLGHAYVTGRTASMDFPTANPLQAVKGDGSDVFVAELNTVSGGLVFSSYLGGSNAYSNGDESYIGGIALDDSGNIYVTGSTGSSDFTTTQYSVQPSFGGGDYDAFVVKIDGGSSVSYVQRTAKSFENSSFVTLPWGRFAAFTGLEGFCR